MIDFWVKINVLCAVNYMFRRSSSNCDKKTISLTFCDKTRYFQVDDTKLTLYEELYQIILHELLVRG